MMCSTDRPIFKSGAESFLMIGLAVFWFKQQIFDGKSPQRPVLQIYSHNPGGDMGNSKDKRVRAAEHNRRYMLVNGNESEAPASVENVGRVVVPKKQTRRRGYMAGVFAAITSMLGVRNV